MLLFIEKVKIRLLLVALQEVFKEELLTQCYQFLFPFPEKFRKMGNGILERGLMNIHNRN